MSILERRAVAIEVSSMNDRTSVAKARGSSRGGTWAESSMTARRAPGMALARRCEARWFSAWSSAPETTSVGCCTWASRAMAGGARGSLGVASAMAKVPMMTTIMSESGGDWRPSKSTGQTMLPIREDFLAYVLLSNTG